MAKKQLKQVPSSGEADVEVSTADVVRWLRINGQFSLAIEEVLKRSVAVAAARRLKLEVTARELQERADAYRLAKGLYEGKMTKTWLEFNGVSTQDFEDYIETDLLIDKLKENLCENTSAQEIFTSPSGKVAFRELAYNNWLDSEVIKVISG